MDIGYSYREKGDFGPARGNLPQARPSRISPDEATDAYIEVGVVDPGRRGEISTRRAPSPSEPWKQTRKTPIRLGRAGAVAWEALEDVAQAATAYARVLELMPPDECPDCIASAREVLADAQRASAETAAVDPHHDGQRAGQLERRGRLRDTWLPDCPAIRLEPAGAGIWSGTFALPAGEWEVKVAINGTWEINFGRLGLLDGLNIPFVLERDAEVTFTFRAANRLLEIDIAR